MRASQRDILCNGWHIQPLSHAPVQSDLSDDAGDMRAVSHIIWYTPTYHVGQVTEIPVPEDSPDQESANDDKQAKSSLRFCMAHKLRLVFTFSKGCKTNEGTNKH